MVPVLFIYYSLPSTRIAVFGGHPRSIISLYYVHCCCRNPPKIELSYYGSSKAVNMNDYYMSLYIIDSLSSLLP